MLNSSGLEGGGMEFSLSEAVIWSLIEYDLEHSLMKMIISIIGIVICY